MLPSDWRTLEDWRRAARDPRAAAAELRRRINALPDVQRRAQWAWVKGSKALEHSFEAAAANKSPVSGAPFALKDLFTLAGTRTSAGANLPTRRAPLARHDGNMAEALARAGAICVGKTHLYEFAYGLTGENATYGDCVLPHHRSRTTGGSSSGSAAAVAWGIVPFSIGTDTGGSMRIPASFCGLHAVRLSPGDSLIRDAFPLAPSFDTAGWFATSAEDLHQVCVALLGPSPRLKRRATGVSFTFADWGLRARAEVAYATRRAGRTLAPAANREQAAALREVSAGSRDAYAILQSREAYAIHKAWLRLKPDCYTPEVRSRLERGQSHTPDQVEWALSHQKRVRAFFAECFKVSAFVVLPGAPFPALKKQECNLANRLRILDVTALASLAGLPVRTLPVPLPSGLHAGLQVVVPDTRSLLALPF
ncbi:MAG: amidase family protein [Opitutaceae bacterium]|nr:amidase family protein [Opitutaceae bacterium]